jgi:hypothetical protein
VWTKQPISWWLAQLPHPRSTLTAIFPRFVARKPVTLFAQPQLTPILWIRSQLKIGFSNGNISYDLGIHNYFFVTPDPIPIGGALTRALASLRAAAKEKFSSQGHPDSSH